MLIHRLYARAAVLAARRIPPEVAGPELWALAGGDAHLLHEAEDHARVVAFHLDGHPNALRAADLLGFVPVAA